MPFFAQFPVLETERLILRQLRYEDGADIHAYFTEELARYYDWWPKTEAEGRGFVRFQDGLCGRTVYPLGHYP